MKKISIIVPAYNEEVSLPYLYERLNNLMGGFLTIKRITKGN